MRGTVTGFNFLLKTPEFYNFIDCRMFQVLKEFQELNWKKLHFSPTEI